jgi:RNA polymerase-binding transcription factor DksA
MENTLYNLMLQYTVESRSLWRMKNLYPADAASDAEAKAFWEKLIAEKEAHLTEIRSLIKARI